MRIPSDRPRATGNTSGGLAGREESSPTMKQYVLSIYPPDGNPPPPTCSRR
jgi:hypothetical protein